MFKEILKKSLAISWHHPLLWLFGFFSALFFVFTNGILLVLLAMERVARGDFLFFNLEAAGTENFFTVPELRKFQNINPLFLIIFLLLIIILFLVAIFAKIFLIFSIKKIATKQNSFFRESWQAAKKKIWPVFLVYLLTFLSLSCLWFLAGFFIRQFTLIPFLQEKLISKIIAPLLVVFLILVTPFVFFITLYAVFYLILEQRKLGRAIKSAFFLFKNNWLKTLILTLILFLIILIFGLLNWLFIDSGILSFPLKLSNLFFTKTLGKYGFWFALSLTTVFVWGLQIFLTGFFTTLQTSCWVLFFLKIKGGNSVDKSKGELEKS